eukprot:2732826-Prorocentrum_lima.AAC.1
MHKPPPGFVNGVGTGICTTGNGCRRATSPTSRQSFPTRSWSCFGETQILPLNRLTARPVVTP